MSKGKEYIKNTFILFLGKFTTQFMSFLLLPLYTNRLETGDYGTIDLIQTYITLFIPVLSLRLDNAVFRFLIDCRNDSSRTRRYISSILNILFGVAIISAIIMVVVPLFVQIPYYISVCINILIVMFSNVLIQIMRGLGKMVHYAVASIIAGMTVFLASIIQILFLGRGAESILISTSIANALCILYVFFSGKIYKYYSPRAGEKKIVKEVLQYSVPLIPHSLSWWIIDVSDRTIINIFLGAMYNGVYTVSCKLSNILNVVFSIFQMSWQESASLHINDPDRDDFFTKMINQLLMFFAGIAIMILAVLPVFYNIIIGEQYWSSFVFIPILLFSNVWSVLSGLTGAIYVARKRTREIAITTTVSAVINLAIDLVLIHFIGLYAATISTLISCLVMAIYRVRDCKKYVKFRMDIMKILFFSLIFAFSSILYYINNPILNIANVVMVCIYIVIENRKNVKGIMLLLKKKKGIKNGSTK